MQHRGIHSVTQVLMPQVLEGPRALNIFLGNHQSHELYGHGTPTGGPNDLLEPCSR
jgi:hypothetical protein